MPASVGAGEKIRGLKTRDIEGESVVRAKLSNAATVVEVTGEPMAKISEYSLQQIVGAR
jgi:hypothetical protein